MIQFKFVSFSSCRSKERKGERERFPARSCDLDSGLDAGLCFSKADPGGWRGNLVETPWLEPGCEKGKFRGQRHKGRDRGKISHPEGKGEVEVQRGHGLCWNPDSGFHLGLSLAR